MDAENRQELMMKMSYLEKQAHELSENINYIASQIVELDEFHKAVKFFSSSAGKENEILSSVGKGLFLKASLNDKNFLVDVGAGVLVRKTPEEAVKIIEAKMRELLELRAKLTAQLELYNRLLAEAVKAAEK